MPRAGKSFEDLTETIFRSLTDDDADVQLERNVYLPGPDGDREIDILIRSHVGPIPLTTVVECRDYKSIINVTQLDAFHSKLEDVNASKGVTVSRRGSSKTARQKAE